MTESRRKRCWAGIGVGGRGKGFHAAVIDERGVRSLTHERDAASIVGTLVSFGPRVVAIDSPITAAAVPHEVGRQRQSGRRICKRICKRTEPDAPDSGIPSVM